MIPKIIHYCWFGKGQKDKKIQHCIESWKRHLSEYEIIEWNEENFDINSNEYCQEAYKNGKWAFVSDYVRLYALYNHGGIYFDTDVEVFKDLECFLEYPVFLGFHSHDSILTAVMGAEAKNKFIELLLDKYNGKKFLVNGQMDMTINNRLITDVCVDKFNLRLDDSNQLLNGDIHVFNSGYFANCNGSVKEINYTVHHGDGSWYSYDKIVNELKSYKKYYFCLLQLMNYELEGKVINRNIKNSKVAIYGNGKLGQLLFKILKNDEITPICIIDKDKNFQMYEQTPIISLNEINNYNIDCIIITPIPYMDEIINDISNIKNNLKIISIEDIYEGN
ncbi:glycosyltransferase [Inconstantimicrobium mannanitabidum]|uniref:Uncharacterized protein n=1 Tax=Inconstantimicrobium mannanitabidum TaxID=1604901 RepID=A0ACB5R8L4_9CLOT|nr:glycosyltransferase [Clostridium sp. TW13]GKX65534.1 hypothetical protein rsdtw13_07920 [Clostridium sp. TW13]